MNEIYCIYALAQRVLCVAVVNDEVGEWSVYVDAVAGQNHINEAEEVALHGCKLGYELAKMMFPQFVDRYVWRY